MLSEVGMRSRIVGNGKTSRDDSENELDLLLRDHRRQETTDRERELNIFRSGSAPPSVEGSLSSVEGLFTGDSGVQSEYGDNGHGFPSEEEMRSDPAYLAYYYSHVNLNPRLPPPTLSKEDWRSAQRLHVGNTVLGGIGDRRKGTSRAAEGGSLESNAQKVVGSGEWLDREGDGLIGLSGFSIGSRPKSSNTSNDVFQDNCGRLASSAEYPSRPASRNAADNLEATANHEISSAEGLRARMNGQKIGNSQLIRPSTSQTFASVLSASLPRAATPDTQRVARVPSPCLPPVGVKIGSTDKRFNNSSSVNSFSAANAESADISSAFSGMNLSRTSLADGDYKLQSNRHKRLSGQQNFLFGVQGGQSHADLTSEGFSGAQRPIVSSSSSYLKSSSASSFGSPNAAAFTSYGLGGYSGSPVLSSMLLNNVGTATLPPLYENTFANAMLYPNLDSRSFGSYSNSTLDLQNLSRVANQTAVAALHMPPVDPLYLQYLMTAEYGSQSALNPNDPSIDRNYDLVGLQKAYIETLLSSQNQYSIPFSGKSASLDHLYYSNPSFGLGMAYQGSSVASPGRTASDRAMNLRNMSGGQVGGLLHPDAVGNINEGFASFMLEEFKGNKSKCFELSEIAGHVVEFSADQFGSRFIQQKLETATSEEKHMVFKEIFPQALSLMTDVFGNYVIQKFFEHGTAAQRRELANQLTGHVLTLSLQMYGCRVIQKAIEVVDLDQQTKMVAELDGHVMRCVRDQNGNHVIQKCIECIHEDVIHFIISSFYDQVVTLSTHPYGCRVIQRVLEHCEDPKTQQIVMDEIMQCVCMLAQDQYGNYVIQHVLEHGKPHERSSIITQLAGQIVQMSQQKFASNVVEKCLAFGGPAERQILVNEMLGTTDENEPLQAMMKDQFANYVVQKVLETCEDRQRELILSRIKVHLNALKKYTYGKHIVARVEKLVAAGERRIGVQSYSVAA